ncbi:MAG: hypothetical protein HY834_20575 [Devosia nanyangense]|uniref:General secretion pathway protein GspM n=1 Tax=Devosia nanyangense TaxID=1228055 RepID=A0A933L6Y7_9HYPH|nr:hypothetical protein [Devosia nanyangense]
MIRDRLVLVVLLSLGLTAIGWGADGFYFGPVRDAVVRIQALSGELASLTQRRTRAEFDLRAASERGGEINGLALRDDDASSAAARFQETIRNAVLQFGGAAMSSQSVSTDLGGGYLKVSVLLRARFDEAGLLAFLRANELSQPPILVESIETYSLPQPGDPRPLDVTATLSEFHVDVTAH